MRVRCKLNGGTHFLKKRLFHTLARGIVGFTADVVKKKIRNAHLYAKMVINTGVIAYQCLTCAV